MTFPFKLTFNNFIDKLKKQEMATDRPQPELHYSENENRFVLYFKGSEWRYFTIMMKEEILDFDTPGEETTKEESIARFRLNFLSHAQKVEEERFDIPSRLIKPTKEFLLEMTKEIDPGEDIIKESKSYDDFIVRNFNRWEKRAISALSNIEVTKNYDLKMQKTFGEFLATLFNGITSLVFLGGVSKFVKDSMLEGHNSAEEDVNKNIDISLSFDAKVKSLSEQQLNGYTINGKKWHGIKGVTAELRQNILNSIRDGVINKESREELNQRVKDLFGTAKQVQAERIARTETNRFLNEGKLQSYKDSELEANKTWLIVDDDVTSKICLRLQAKYGKKGIPFDEPFLDDKTGKEFMNPPAHVNCRSIVGISLPGE